MQRFCLLIDKKSLDDWRNTRSCFNQIKSSLVQLQSQNYAFYGVFFCHPDDLAVKFGNIKICFLPPNTTSTLQPLDLGIITNFKVHYQQYFFRSVLSKIDECDSASDVVKSVDILVAIRWVALAWSQVTTETITKCFKKAGILDVGLDVVNRGIEDDSDPSWRLMNEWN